MNVSYPLMGILRDIDEEMRRAPAYGKGMLQPIGVLRLERFEASAMISRVLLKTRPTQQGRIAVNLIGA